MKNENGMQTLTGGMIESWGLCEDARPYFLDWEGTILDVLKAEHIPARFRLGVALNPEALPPEVWAPFAAWAAERATEWAQRADAASQWAKAPAVRASDAATRAAAAGERVARWSAAVSAAAASARAADAAAAAGRVNERWARETAAAQRAAAERAVWAQAVCAAVAARAAQRAADAADERWAASVVRDAGEMECCEQVKWFTRWLEEEAQ